MEVVFLRRSDLAVLDFGFVDRNFQIVMDCVIPQKSTFVVNKVNINASVGDLLIVKEKEVNYIGIIVSLVGDDSKFTTSVQTVDFISILDLQVKLPSFTGNLSVYLCNLIQAAFINTSDPKQRLSYLSVNRDDVTEAGTLNYEADTLGTISSVVETLNKAYSLGVKYNLEYLNGKITGISLRIASCTRGIIIRSNLAAIANLEISNDSTQSKNKVEFIPSDSNTSYRSPICYYLLKDGVITNDPNDSRRFDTVYSVTKIFKDADYSTLATTAQSELLKSSLEHSITFDLRMDNKVVAPFQDITVGDFVQFITPSKIYNTMVTQITLKNTLATAGITLGEYRGSLTDKIKLLSKKQGG